MGTEEQQGLQLQQGRQEWAQSLQETHNIKSHKQSLQDSLSVVLASTKAQGQSRSVPVSAWVRYQQISRQEN